jgi:hypothetical protein
MRLGEASELLADLGLCRPAAAGGRAASAARVSGRAALAPRVSGAETAEAALQELRDTFTDGLHIDLASVRVGCKDSGSGPYQVPAALSCPSNGQESSCLRINRPFFFLLRVGDSLFFPRVCWCGKLGQRESGPERSATRVKNDVSNIADLRNLNRPQEFALVD